MTEPRIFAVGGRIAFRALFNWLQPSVYIPTMFGSPVFQILFFAYLGRYSGLADDRFFVIGNAVAECCLACLYGMVMMVYNERQFGTLTALFATPAGRFAMFYGRAIPAAGNGLLVTTAGLAAGCLLLGVRLPLGALPAIAVILVLTALSCAMFGLALGAVAMRLNDIWVTSNVAYMLLLLLCGVNVPSGRLPSWLAGAGEGLPLTHGIQAVRALASGAGAADVAGLVGREVLVGGGYAVLGYALLRVFEAENRRRASLT